MECSKVMGVVERMAECGSMEVLAMSQLHVVPLGVWNLRSRTPSVVHVSPGLVAIVCEGRSVLLAQRCIVRVQRIRPTMLKRVSSCKARSEVLHLLRHLWKGDVRARVVAVDAYATTLLGLPESESIILVFLNAKVWVLRGTTSSLAWCFATRVSQELAIVRVLLGQRLAGSVTWSTARLLLNDVAVWVRLARDGTAIV